MKTENSDCVFRTHVLFSLLSLSLVPNAALAFDLDSVYKRGIKTIGHVKESAREIFHDSVTFDDTAVNHEVEPLLISLKEAQRVRVNRINELMHTNRPLAIDLEQQEARRRCDIFPIEARLQAQIDQNCRTSEIRKRCELASLSTVTPITDRAEIKVAELSKNVSIPNILRLEKELVADFRSVQMANEVCSNTYETLLMGSACKNTYKNFFADFKEQFVNSCSDTSVIEALEKFTIEMRDFNHSSRVDLTIALTVHSKSRTAEINLARTIEHINATRLMLEHASGKETGSDNGRPTEKPNQFESYHGS